MQDIVHHVPGGLRDPSSRHSLKLLWSFCVNPIVKADCLTTGIAIEAGACRAIQKQTSDCIRLIGLLGAAHYEEQQRNTTFSTFGPATPHGASQYPSQDQGLKEDSKARMQTLRIRVCGPVHLICFIWSHRNRVSFQRNPPLFEVPPNVEAKRAPPPSHTAPKAQRTFCYCVEIRIFRFTGKSARQLQMPLA